MVDQDDDAGPMRIATAYEEHGRARSTAPPVVLLHGGLVGGATWRAQVPALAAGHHVYVPDRRGHGRTPDVDGEYTYEAMADETIVFLDEVVGRPADLVGFSDGGNVALHVARDRPDLVDKMVVIGANYHHDGLHPAFLAGLRGEAGAPSWVRTIHHAAPGSTAAGQRAARGTAARVAAKVEQMWRCGPTMTLECLHHIDAPVLVMVGDDDCVAYEHTVALFEALPRGQLAVVPGTSHLVIEEKPALVNTLILDFLDDGRPLRRLPMRFAADRR